MCVSACACTDACSDAFGIYVSVCIMCLTSLSDAACGGYTNTERVIYTSRKLWWFLSDLAYSSLIWLGLGLVLTYFQPTQS